MPAPQRQIVLVSGAPGAGKSTLAGPLAAELGFALLSKDIIKEALWDAVNPPAGDRPWSRRLGGAAMEVLWALAARSPRAVLEANFRPHSAYERGRILGLGAAVAEVYCDCPPDEAARRYAVRGAGPDRHPAHVVAVLAPDYYVEYDRPMGIGTVIRVDTTHPVDVRSLAERLRPVFSDGASGRPLLE